MSIATVAVPACPLCRSASREAAYTGMVDRVHAVPGSWSFFRCTACGAFYQDPIPADLRDGYPESYPQHVPPAPPRLQHARFAAGLRALMRKAILRAHGYKQFRVPAVARVAGRVLHALGPMRAAAFQAHLLLPRARPGGTLLDVGCGNGRFLGFAQLVGWRAIGIEPDPASAAVARTLTGATVYASFDEARLEPASIDAITMNHILEHAADPRALLAQCRALLRPGGVLGVAVPNWRSLSHRLFRRDWIALEPSRHLVMFDETRLRALLVEAGFEVEELAASWIREVSPLTRSLRLRFARPLPRGVERLAEIVAFAAGLVVRRGGGEIIAFARAAQRADEQLASGNGQERHGHRA